MSDARALQHAIKLVANSELFDAAWYLARYRDAGIMDMDAAEHYVRLGARLLRDPSLRFSAEYYVASYPDVAQASIDPFIHYVVHGQREGRRPLPPSASEEKRPAAAGKWERFSEDQVAAIRKEFDSGFYRLQYSPPEDVDPFEHFMHEGWRRGHDPNADFSTSYYLRRSPDIAKAGINPFAHYILHGRAEKRQVQSYHRRLARGDFNPKVSVIVPNYNHGRFLAQRIDSILAQTYQNFDLLILDDCSNDDSREVIADYCRRFPDRVRSMLNVRNAGNVFRQWRKGAENVDGDLVWICESDDFCEPDFLAGVVACFRDRSVNIAFGRIQFCDREGKFQEGLDQYREGAEAGTWSNTLVRPAQQWFAGGFGVNNVIPNVGGCVWRRQALPDAIWSQAEGYRVLGDWFLYCHLAGGGQIAYEPGAVAYFRQHGGNTSVTSFTAPGYYAEHQRLMTVLKQRWEIPDATVEKFLGQITHQYRHFNVAETHGDMSRYVDRQALLDVRRSQPHILIAFLGFYPGGGEFFPLYLANALHAQGCLVSMLACNSEGHNQEMSGQLDPAIPVYDASYLTEIGVDAFLDQAGISLIHSHMVSCESVFFGTNRMMRSPIPYLVTLHGSYEACAVEAEQVARFAEGVSHWVYTTERNLEPFRTLDLPQERFSKLPNGMPVDPRPFPTSRAELGLSDDTVVFTLVARGITRKGWRAAIEAFIRLRRRNPQRRIHLLLCGDGPEADRYASIHGTDPDITFLGFQSCISGLYRLTDCAIVPTRYAGESFPLCLIQALQVGTPAIATRVGQIEEMISQDGATAGILIEAVRDTHVFIEALTDAMEKMLSKSRRKKMAKAALVMGKHYMIANIASRYRSLYDELLPTTTAPVPEQQ